MLLQNWRVKTVSQTAPKCTILNIPFFAWRGGAKTWGGIAPPPLQNPGSATERGWGSQKANHFRYSFFHGMATGGEAMTF